MPKLKIQKHILKNNGGFHEKKNGKTLRRFEIIARKQLVQRDLRTHYDSKIEHSIQQVKSVFYMVISACHRSIITLPKITKL